jgi:tRNA U34 5-methylaminomethyl-2-thiouridine-forming methyltransferase MnmC
MSEPLIPATVAFRPNGSPYSPLYGDIYHSVVGSVAQAQYVFLQGNGLPGRWQGRTGFTVLETGFGMGINFLTTWAAWRADSLRGDHLHFVSIEKHPFSAGDLRLTHAATIDDAPVAALAQTLADAWPDLVPGTHTLAFDNNTVTLTLIFDDAVTVLPTLNVRADAFYLDGFAPARNPELWTPSVFESLGALANEGATFSTYTSAGDVKRALLHAGFEYKKIPGFGWKRAMLAGKYLPR